MPRCRVSRESPGKGSVVITLEQALHKHKGSFIHGWRDWAAECQTRNLDEDYDRMPWEQDTEGLCPQVGTLAKNPVRIAIFWNRIGGVYNKETGQFDDRRLVLFWEATSRVVDFEMVEKWLEERTPNAKVRTNAMNFHLVAHAITRGE